MGEDEREPRIAAPLWTFGAAVALFGLLRRRPLVFAVGLAVVWIDRRGLARLLGPQTPPEAS